MTMDVPPTSTIESAVEAAQEMCRRVRKMIPAGHEHLSSVTETRNLSDDLMQMASAARRLKGKNAEHALAEAIEHYGLKKGTQLEGAAAFLRMRLSELSEKLDAMAKGHKNSWEALKKTVKPIIEKKSAYSDGLVMDSMNKYEKWIENASRGQRMAFGAGCIGVGSLCMYVGGEWLSQAFYGRGVKQVEVPDGQGSTTMIPIARPLPAAERVLKGVLGTGGLAAGLAGSWAGFSHLLHGR